MVESEFVIYAVLHHPESYSARSGLYPLVEQLHATPVFYRIQWERLQRQSWSAGQVLRHWGCRYYGSAWNALIPVWDEWWIRRRIASEDRDKAVVHFLFGEFAAPRDGARMHRRARGVYATFHCSARRLPSVLGKYRCLEQFDAISVMSKTQIPFFIERGFPADRIHVTLHGVDTKFFRPKVVRRAHERVLRMLLVGSTERDHAFAAELMRTLIGEPFELSVRTSAPDRDRYAGLANVRMLGALHDEGLRDAYCEADLLLMPLLDCTANNAVLESIACGTPVMVNRIGGITEYLDSSCAVILDGKATELWRHALCRLHEDRDELDRLRVGARARAESVDWARQALAFQRLYSRVDG